MTADVLVIGGGPAGIAAATRAAQDGRGVVVLDESPNVGGQIWRHRSRSSLDADARRRIERLGRTRAQVHSGVAVVDVVPDPAGAAFTVVAERLTGEPLSIRATSLVIATGARERFVPFPGWTLSGVYGIGGAQALLKQGMGVAGKRVVIAGTGPLMLPVAASLTAARARVRLVADQASFARVREFGLSLLAHPDTLLQAMMYRLGFMLTPYTFGAWVVSAGGSDRVTHVVVTDGRKEWRVDCDVLCTGYGLVPNVELARLVGCVVANGVVRVDDRQETSVRNVFAAGEVTGIGGVALALVEGEIAGAAAAGASHIDTALMRRRAALREMALRMERTFALRGELRQIPRDDTIACRCEDVRIASLGQLGDARQAKLYTRAGMGACQGRVCGPALEFLYGWEPGTVRSPVEPVRLATLAVVASAVASASPSSASADASLGS
jgi:NADPH-dependent 2,4-dienoyl-CoA reductase/sulfur reductase-like enzyme